MKSKETEKPGPLPNSYWVRPARLLAGEYPRDKALSTSRPKLRRLLGAGVTYFLDLTEADEGLEPYAELAAREAAALDRTVAHHRAPIRDFSAPPPEYLVEILDQLDRALEAGEVVYLHCWGGIGRTGLVVAAHLVRHGLAPEEALQTLARLRRGTPDGWRPSPETQEQRALVLSWTRER